MDFLDQRLFDSEKHQQSRPSTALAVLGLALAVLLFVAPFSVSVNRAEAAEDRSFIATLLCNWFAIACPQEPVAIQAPLRSPEPPASPTAPLPTVASQPSAPATTTIVQQITNPVIERVVERVASPAPLANEGISETLLNTRLNEFETVIASRYFANPVRTISSLYETVGAMGRIEHLDKLNLTSPTLTGGSISGASVNASSLSITGTSTFAGAVGIGTTNPGVAFEVVGDIISKGTKWTARSAAENNAWQSITYGNGLFVALSSDGTNRVMTSPDGINWTARAAAEANTWRSITYGNGLFVAVTDSGTNRVMTSPDGINWTARAAAEASGWFAITHGNGLFVAVARTGTNRVMTSPDGITWTPRTAAEQNDWRSITYGNGLFVAGAHSGTNRIMTSPDGINWTARAAAEDNLWRSITYGNGIFVAVTQVGTNRVMTSPDGITWTARAAAEANGWFSVTYGNGLFVAVASEASGTNRVMTSSDGITWTPRTAAEENGWRSITYGNGIFVAVAETGTNRVMTSGKLEQAVTPTNNIYQGGMSIFGNVGIGTTTPYSRLTVWGSNTASTSAFAVVNSASTTVLAAYNNGNVTYSGSLFQSSDERLKTNIEALTASDTLMFIEKLNPVSYTRIDQPDQGKTLGFIAQEVQELFPDLVTRTDATALTPDGTLTLNYTGLIPPITKAIQAVAAQLADIATTLTSFADRFITRELTFVRATGDEIEVNVGKFKTLCVDDVCITRDQFAAMLSAAGQSAAPVAPTDPPPTDPTPVTPEPPTESPLTQPEEPAEAPPADPAPADSPADTP